MGLEGTVSKRLGSRYRSGRSKDWLKFKNRAAPAVKREAAQWKVEMTNEKPWRKLQSPLSEFGNGPVLSPVTGARTEKGTRERKLGPPRYCWSGTAGEAQLKQSMKYG
jgi:hypothetical protein